MEYGESIKRYLMIESVDRKGRAMDAMEKFFIERTRKHIGRVQDFVESACEFYPALADDLRERGRVHDSSKFMIPERKYYIILTWMYKSGQVGKEFKISDSDRKHMNDITFHHCKNNPHHPEAWDKNLTKNPINPNVREKRDIIANATAMDDLSILEMVCDWSAMSVENGEKSGPRKWADDSIAGRWKFSKHQQGLIYESIDLLWS